MKHPNSEKCFQLADIFEAVVKRHPEGQLDMMTVEVSDLRHGREHRCGTVHCHAGWALVGISPEKVNIPKTYVSFHEGVVALDEFFFGASDEVADNGTIFSALTDWADRNPSLWGNGHGSIMFSSKIAFYHGLARRKGALTLKHIADHWREVGKRVANMEKKKIKPQA